MGIAENRHAREVRRRLQYPVNAVPDLGINLRRKAAPALEVVVRLGPKPIETPVAKEAPPVPALPVLPVYSPPIISSHRIISLLSKHSGFAVDDLLSRSKKGPVTLARHVGIWLCLKHMPSVSLSRASQIFKRGDHTTIMHARNRIRGYQTALGRNANRARELISLIEADLLK